MSDIEVQDPVVQEEKKDELSPLAEETTPKPESQEVAEEVADLSEERKTIPKERWDQLYARTKRAEADKHQLREELQREREERIRLEERTKVHSEQQTQQEMTWAQLEQGIQEGRWTRDQAQEYKDKMTEARLERKFKEKQAAESSNSRILGEINQYQQLIPDVMSYGSESRQKYEREFSYMTRTLGMPDNYATQLAAVRAAFGDIETVKARQTAKTVLTNKEPFVETHTSQSKMQKPVKSFEDSLPEYKREHYKKLMKGGVVKSWKEAEELENYKPSMRRA